MRLFSKKVKRDDVLQWGSGVVVLFSFIYPVIHSITRAPIKSDATLNLYIAQQLAAGARPYTDYFIMHPPISHFFGALTVLLSESFSISAVLGTRFLALLLCLLIMGVTYLLARDLVEDGELLAVWAVSGNVFMLMVIWGFYEKLVMVLFLYLAVYMLNKDRVFAGGIFAGLVLMTWGGSILIVPAFLIVFIVRREISWQKFLLGFFLTLGIVVVALAMLGSLVHFYQQYFLTVIEYGINKLTFSGVRDAEIGVSNIRSNTNLSKIDALLLVGSGVSFFVFLFLKKRPERFAKKSIAILAITFVSGISILLDYQSPFDLIILFPALSILFAWSAFRLIHYWVDSWNVAFDPVYIFVFLLVFGLVRVFSFQRVPNRLFAQKEAAAHLQTLIDQEEVLFLGDLSTLVLAEGKNPSRVIHLGPKSFLAMRNEGYTVYEYLEDVSGQSPAIILVDQRNLEHDYLTVFYWWLEDHYVYLGNTNDPTMNVYINRESKDAMIPALAFMFNHNPGSSTLQEMDLIEKTGIVESFYAINDQVFLIGYRVSDDLQLYWWSSSPQNIYGEIVYRFLTETGEVENQWLDIEQRWYSGEISLTDLPFVDVTDTFLGIEFCIRTGDDFIDSCEDTDVVSLLVSREYE